MLKRSVAALMSVLLVAAAFTGCTISPPIDTDDGAVGFTYILDESGYTDFKKLAENRESFAKLKNKFSSVDEITSGKTYYIVAYTLAKTSDDSVVKFDNSGSLTLEVSDTDRPASEIVSVSDYGYIDIGKQEGSIKRVDSENDSEITYEVRPTTTISSAECCAFLKFTATDDFRLDVTYKICSTKKKNHYGFVCERKAGAEVYFSTKADLVGFRVSYLDAESYVDGRYSDENLKSSIDLEVGQTGYMVVSAKTKNLQDIGDNLTVDFVLELTGASLVKATLDTADSGKFTETEVDGVKRITVTSKMPSGKDDEKDFVFIIKLTRVASGRVTANFKFKSNWISIVENGNITEKDIW